MQAEQNQNFRNKVESMKNGNTPFANRTVRRSSAVYTQSWISWSNEYTSHNATVNIHLEWGEHRTEGNTFVSNKAKSQQ